MRLWGFCDACEGWLLTSRWFDDAEGPSCPRCGARPSALEEVQGDVTLVTVMLELPPGAEEPLIG